MRKVFAILDIETITDARLAFDVAWIDGCLALAAQGAEGETKAQFESLFGMSADELVSYCSALSSSQGPGTRMPSSCWK